MLEKSDILPMVKKYGIFAGIVVGMVAVLVTVTLLARAPLRRGLGEVLQDTLNTFHPDTYLVSTPVPLSSTFSAAVYTVTLRNPATVSVLNYYGVIVRIPTIAGPAPAVFLYSQELGIEFVGYALPYGKAATVFESNIGLKIIQYWENQVKDILVTAGVEVSR